MATSEDTDSTDEQRGTLGSRDNRVGETVENYRLKSILGTGSTSIVYLGQPLDGGEQMAAIKVLTFHDAAASVDRATFRTRFLREARAVRKLRHEHILPVLSYGEVDDLTYMIMPLVTGGTLAARMTGAREPLPLAEIAAYCRQLASALDYAHEQGIVHRDVKPSNVLLDESLDKQGSLYLTDFGIARLYDIGANTITAGHIGLTQTGQVLGTPYYMAPEQIRGEPVGPATDIYALGVVMYQLVTGQVPYQGDTPLAVALQHLQDDPCPPSLLRSGLPPAAEAAILRAMAKQPADRFASASELADALEQAVRDAQNAREQNASNDPRMVAQAASSTLPRLDDNPYASLVGTTLGSYQLEQAQGASDLGAVFQARSGPEGGVYRLRVLALAGGQPAESRSISLGRIQQLAHAVAELQHPNILPLLDYGSAHGLPYLVSPQPSGPALAQRLEQTGQMDLVAAGRILDRIADALEYAHEHERLHLNLNTHCVFVEGSREPQAADDLRVADFEVRRMVEVGLPKDQASTLYHNTEACAPEQLQGKPVGTYTDVYALGVVLYALLTGRPLFTGATKDDIAQQHLYSPPPPLRRWRAGLPAALENIVARALAKEPRQRFQHPAELASAYRQIVGSASASATFNAASPGASPAAGSVLRPATPSRPASASMSAQPAFVTPLGQQAQIGGAGAEGNATLAASPGPSLNGHAETGSRAPLPAMPTAAPAIAAGGANGSASAASSRYSGPSQQISDPAGTPPVVPVGVAPASTPPGRRDGPPARGIGKAGGAATAIRNRLGLPAWALYLVTAVVLFALLFGFFVAAKNGIGPLGNAAYADAAFTTPGGDVGYWANEGLTITASNLGSPPSGTRYVAWLMNVPNPNSEPTQSTRLGPLTAVSGQSNTWTVTYNAKPYTNLMGQGNEMEIIAEKTSEQSPLTPAPGDTVILAGTYPAASYQHIGHLLLAFDDTPEHAGILASMRHQTFILQGEAQAIKEAAYRGDSFAVSCHAQSVLDIVEGAQGQDYAPLSYQCQQNVTDQVGDGYGFLGTSGQGKYTHEPYIQGVEYHMNLAKEALGSTGSASLPQLSMHAGHVYDAMEHVRTLLTAVQSDALKLRQNPGAGDASNTSVDLASKVDAALQYAEPEGATADPTQYGVVDAFNHTEYAATLRLTPPNS